MEFEGSRQPYPEACAVSTMKSAIKRIARIVAGVVLVIIGIAGLVFPIMPGWVFIIPGALLLGFDIGWLLWALKRGELRYPKYRPAFRKLRQWVHAGRMQAQRHSDP